MAYMSYEDRLRRYEEEKRQLQQQGLNDVEYLRAIIKLADKWKI